MYRSFLQSLQENCHVRPGSGLVVACSGGADSMALLELLAMAASDLDLRLTVAHLDHALRPESAEDARFVAARASRLGLVFRHAREDVAGITARERGNLEAVARRLRRRFLLQVARDCEASLIALGHHRDDQAETVLFRILRGSGTDGLAGMAAYAPPFIRPLLGFSRLELQQFLLGRQLGWREDASNLDLARTRNRLRHEVLPLLERVRPGAATRLAALAARVGCDEDYWQTATCDWAAAEVRREPDGLSFSLPALVAQHPALRHRVWLRLLREVGGREEYGEVHLRACEGLLRGAPQCSLDLPGVWVARRYQQILLRSTPPPPMAEWQLEIPGPGDVRLPDGRLLRIELATAGAGDGRQVVEFAAESVTFPLQLRNRRPGDRFRPQGAPGGRKLKAFFIDARVSREDRAAQPLLVADEILWVVGMRRCHGRLPQSGGRALRCHLLPSSQEDKTS